VHGLDQTPRSGLIDPVGCNGSPASSHREAGGRIRRTKIRVAFENPDMKLKPNMFANATFLAPRQMGRSHTGVGP
jgi:hypothetical protein